MTSSAAPLDCLVSKAGQLYSLPAVAMEVLELTSNPQVDVPALKQCIENDPALTTKVLRVVNSSLFGLTGEVSDLNQALALLGTKPLKLLVLGFSLPEGLFDGLAEEVLGRYWRHTLVKAVAAREISETLCGQSGDEAFIAGLLQDLGILLLIQALGHTYLRFLEKVHATGGDLAALETESLGFDHTILTSRLLDHWGLPEVVVRAVRKNPAGPPPISTPRPGALPQILHLAGLVAQLLADGRSEVLPELLADGDRSYGLSQEQLEELVDNLEHKVGQLADVLSLRLPQGGDYRDVLIEAHSQLAQVAAEAAEDLVRHRAAHSGPEGENPELFDEFRALSEAITRIAQTDPDPSVSAPLAQPAPEAAGLPGQRAGNSSPSSPWSASAETRVSQAGSSTAEEPDPGLLGRLDAAVSACRQSQCALTLLLVELDDVDKLMITCGVEGLGEVRRLVETICRSVDHPQAICLPYRDVGFAVILPDCERQPAVRLANQLVDRVRRQGPGGPFGGTYSCPTDGKLPGRPAVTVSVGAATLSVPTKNFPPADLFEGAQRCLYGSHASAGGVVKSIEIY